MRCPHCRYRVIGLKTARCPECGGSFSWPDVLQAARARQNGLFEHQWNDRAVRALARTWWLAAFRPRRLWARQSLADPPRVKPLLAFAIVQCALFTVSWLLIGWLVEPQINQAARWLATNLDFNYRFRLGRHFFATTGVWYVAAFLGLQLFVQSKRRYGIGWRNTLRVYVHATAFASLCMLLSACVEVLIDTAVLLVPSFRGLPFVVYDRVQRGILLLGLLITWAHLWTGYARHLNVPRGWGTAALSLLFGYVVSRIALIYL